MPAAMLDRVYAEELSQSTGLDEKMSEVWFPTIKAGEAFRLFFTR